MPFERGEILFSKGFSIYTDIRKLQDKAKTSYTLSTRSPRFGKYNSYTKNKDKRITQFFDNNDSLEIGVETKVYNGTEIRIFNRERMMVELIRNKSKFSFDYYKEIITNYRKLIYELDIQAVQKYACQLPKTRLVLETLQMEVF